MQKSIVCVVITLEFSVQGIVFGWHIIIAFVIFLLYIGINAAASSVEKAFMNSLLSKISLTTFYSNLETLSCVKISKILPKCSS
jgi:hypothetical protein